MHLRTLDLEEFRVFHRLHLDLPSNGLAISGSNAAGKSSLIEAIAFLATTRSIRSAPDRDLINWESGQELGYPPFARLSGQVVRSDGVAEIEIALQADPTGVAPLTKSIRLNGRAVRAMDLVGTLRVVLFSPEDVALVSGPPSGRRRYLDVMISQVDTRYMRTLARYNRVHEQRNSLLKSLGQSRVDPDSPAVASQLEFWDEELVTYGASVIARRMVSIQALSRFADARFETFGSTQTLGVAYRPSVGEEAALAASEGRFVEDLSAIIRNRYLEQLRANRRDELRRGITLYGPHRDDLVLTLDGRDLAAFGSRGQQRLAVVALKLGETDLMAQESGERPVVLLDDVLSELDAERREQLLAAVGALDAQIIITATDASLLDIPALADLTRYEIRAGKLYRADSVGA